MTGGRTVVGVDGSPGSSAALRWAVEVAAPQDGVVDAVRAWHWDLHGFGIGPTRTAPDFARESQAAVEEQVDDALARRPPDAPAVRVRPRACEGDPATVLPSLAAGAALLVLAPHGQSALRRRLRGPSLGSVASHCLDRSATPVAIARTDRPAAPGARVVVGVDGSPGSSRALRWAVQHAGVLGLPVVAVHCWQAATTVPVPSSAALWSVPALADVESAAADVLYGAVERAGSDAAAAGVQRVLLHAPAAAGLVELAEPGDTLVLGDRGRGGFTRLLLGSVSRQCAEHAPCTVVVVPAPARGTGA